MDSKLKLVIDTFGKERFKFDESIKYHTFLQIGGPAKLFFIALTESDLIKIIQSCRQLRLPYFLFGIGSKIMFSDNGFNGVVVKNRTSQVKVISVKGKISRLGLGVDEAFVEISSGVSISKMVEFLDSQRLASSEFANLPGTLGGNLFLNKSLQDKTEGVKVLGVSGKIEKISARELSLSKHVILSAILRIKAK